MNIYRSGGTGFFRRVGNLAAVTGNLINGFISPKGSNAFLSEGARRQMLGAAIHPDSQDKTGTKGSITDEDHLALGGIQEHSGEEFRRGSGFGDYLDQMMTAPYHNIFGQTAQTKQPDGTYFVGANKDNPDAYTYNNYWNGNKVTKVYGNGEGTGSLIDAIKAFNEARKSKASIKAALETAASVRGVNVQAKEKGKNVVTLDDINNYYDEYKKYLSMSPKKRAKENKKLRRE